MNYKIEKVKKEEKEILYRMLQFALYDGSQYIENKINNKGLFEYKWFDNYFTDDNQIPIIGEESIILHDDNTPACKIFPKIISFINNYY